MTSITKNNPEEGVGAPNFQPITRFRLERVSYKRSTLDYIKKQIDNAYDNNGWLIIYSHMSVDPYDENKIKEILSYAKEKERVPNSVEFAIHSIAPNSS